ncbi:unnamed protein product [Symbiodinium sp. KB8]|nr:unnamed protein product [Symbiodinium sp. KB8]
MPLPFLARRLCEISGGGCTKTFSFIFAVLAPPGPQPRLFAPGEFGRGTTLVRAALAAEWYQDRWKIPREEGGTWHRVGRQACVGAMGAVVAALLQAFSEPVLNRVAVKRLRVLDAIREVRLIDILRFFRTVLATNLLKFPFFEAVTALSSTWTAMGAMALPTGLSFFSLLLGVAQAGIYPDNHWDFSTELTADSADAFVKENVDAGKTVFIRWIASAPSWNSVAETFGKHPDVVFGDVALSKNQVRKIHGEDQSPGSGGWPTVRFFNKETGYGGKPYPKKTSMAMCDELGPKENYLREWIEEFATLCDANATDKKGCSEQQLKFIEKWAGKSAAELKSQLTRLKGMLEKDGASMKPDALKWVKARAKLIEQMSQKAEL